MSLAEMFDSSDWSEWNRYRYYCHFVVVYNEVKLGIELYIRLTSKTGRQEDNAEEIGAWKPDEELQYRYMYQEASIGLQVHSDISQKMREKLVSIIIRYIHMIKEKCTVIEYGPSSLKWEYPKWKDILRVVQVMRCRRVSFSCSFFL